MLQRCIALLLFFFGAPAPAFSVIVWQPEATGHWLADAHPKQSDALLNVTAFDNEPEPFVIAAYPEASDDQGAVSLSVDIQLQVDIRVVDFRGRRIESGPYAGQEIDLPFWLFPQAAGEGRKIVRSALLAANRKTAWWCTIGRSKPGIYKGAIRMTAGDKLVRQLPLEVRVLPIALSHADIGFGLFFQEARLPEFARSATYLDAIYADFSAHGHTTATFYEYGNWSRLPPTESALLEGIPRGYKAGLLHRDIPVVALMSPSEKILSSQDHTSWFKQKTTALNAPPVLWYVVDEPGDFVTVDKAVNVAKSFRQAGFPTVAALPVPWLGFLGPSLDVALLPLWTSTAGLVDEALWNWAKIWKTALWSYSTQLRACNALLNREYAGLFTWAKQFAGNMPWAYVHDPSYALNSEGVGQPSISHGYVLPTPEGIVPGVGWEGRREGIKDYRLLRLLETEAKRSPTRAENKKSLAWLTELRHKLLANATWYGEEKGYYWDLPDTHRMFADPSLTPSAVRREATGLLMGVRGAK